MPLDVYFRENIANVLRAVNMAGGGTTALVEREIAKLCVRGQSNDLAEHLGLYRQGYADALRAVAAAFGIWPFEAGSEGPLLAGKARRGEVVNTRVFDDA